MSIMEKAQELGDVIVESQEFSDLKAAEEAMGADKAAQEIIQEFQAKQRKAQMAQRNGKPVSDELKKELQGIQAKMQQNEHVKGYMEAQEKFGKVMQTVNQVISAAIQGEECDSDCGAGCC
ncbi:YlbF family regulator [Natroniella sp. ANB-PHB2]|uniref:YlbF family regulator n=1 Tax=Natroniella sp. ANB-PHB2 TaxID=3384444 RepID=UPI0038D462FF